MIVKLNKVDSSVLRDLARLIRDYDAPREWQTQSVYELLVDNSDRYSNFLEHYVGNKASPAYDVDVLVEALDLALAHAKPRTPESLHTRLQGFLAPVIADWICVFPLDFSGLFTERHSAIGTNHLDDFTLVSKLKDHETLTKFIAKAYRGAMVNKDAYDSQVSIPKMTISKRPLLCFNASGTPDGVRWLAITKFQLFKSVTNLFLALDDHRVTLHNRLETTTQHFFLIDKRSGMIHRWPLMSGSRILASPTGRTFKKFQHKGFSRFIGFFLDSKDPMAERLRNSLHFLSKGFDESDTLSRFVFNIIALESLFSKDRYAQIRTALADYVSLLCYPPKERLAIHKRVQELYDKRSSIVHEGRVSILDTDVQDSQRFASKALLKSIRFCLAASSSGRTDQLFFDQLLRLKLKPR